MFIGAFNVGVALYPDYTSAGAICTAFAILTGGGKAVATALAVPIGLLGAFIFVGIKIMINTTFGQFMLRALENDNSKKASRIYIAGSFFSCFIIYFIYAFVCIYVGSGAVEAAVNAIPKVVINGLTTSANLLPAIGFAMLLQMIISKKMAPFFFIGFIFSIYVLFQKETLARQTKKILYAFTKEKTAQKVLRVVRLANTTFASFLSGQCLEACILGTMFCVTMLVIRLPYALLIGIVIAITALIPIVGAFIGCVVGIILIGLVNPVKAVIFVIMFFVLQQIEGNLIYPHVVGSSVGLPGMWVLMAVTVGGSLFGIVGMLTFIPICSVCYALFRLFVNERLKEKREI